MLQVGMSKSCTSLGTSSAHSTATKEIDEHKAMLSDPSTVSPTSSESTMIAKRYKINQSLAPVAALSFKVEDYSKNATGSVCPSKHVAEKTTDEKANNLHGKDGPHIDCGRESDSKENHPKNNNFSFSDASVDERRDVEIWYKTTPCWDCIPLDEGLNSVPASQVVAAGSTSHVPALRVRSNHTPAASTEGTKISCKAGLDEAPGCFAACGGTQTAWTTASSVQLEESIRAPEAIGAAMGPKQSLSRATRGRQGVSAVEGSLRQLVLAAGCDLSSAAKDAVDPNPVTFDLPSASTAASLQVHSKRFYVHGRVCALSRTVSWASVARVLVLAILAQLCQLALADTYAYNVPDTEIAALQDLYDATNGDSWIWSDTGNQWNFTDPNPCYDHWQGINCTQAPSDGFLHVLAVDLPGFGLAGSIPDSLAQLTQLQLLYLDSNELTGTIPASLGQLLQMTILSFDLNLLIGIIPESLHQLTQLTELYLDDNHLTGTIPASLEQLLHLQVLALDSNQLMGNIPESLQKLTQLTELYLDNNQLTSTIPASIKQLTQLTGLYLDYNQLTGTIPASLGQLLHLHVLALASNQLMGNIPDSIHQLTQLTQLYLDTNHLTGTIPASLGQLTRLKILTLEDNRLTGTMPDPFQRLTQMIFLDVSDNWLTGTIAGLFTQLTRIVSLRLESNLLTGTIPAYLGQLPTLSVLGLDFNRFTGSIPQNWSTASATMRVLHLNENHLSGTIPESLGHMPLLLSLNLSSNHLTGTIPTSFQQLCNLTCLFASGRLYWLGLNTPSYFFNNKGYFFRNMDQLQELLLDNSLRLLCIRKAMEV